MSKHSPSVRRQRGGLALRSAFDNENPFEAAKRAAGRLVPLLQLRLIPLFKKTAGSGVQSNCCKYRLRLRTIAARVNGAGAAGGALVSAAQTEEAAIHTPGTDNQRHRLRFLWNFVVGFIGVRVGD